MGLRHEHHPWKNGGAHAEGQPKRLLLLNLEETAQFQSVAVSRSLPHGLVSRAKIVLLSASGMSNQAIAARLALHPVTVGRWRQRFLRHGLRGLHDELRPGRPRSIVLVVRNFGHW